jgi:hypothetical protein
MTNPDCYDYIVIGTVSAGCVLAKRPSVDPDKVLLLEAIVAQDVEIMNPACFSPPSPWRGPVRRAVARCFPMRADRGAP